MVPRLYLHCFVVVLLSVPFLVRPARGDVISADNMNFTTWDILLRTYLYDSIRDGINVTSVNFTGMASDPLFKEFGASLSSANTTGFNKTQHYAFWMNAYNYLAIKTIVDNPCMQDMFYPGCGPIQSIRQIGQQQPSIVTNTVWGLIAGNVGGMPVSLDDIENNQLRNPPNAWSEDARLHACIVCASISCPDLRKGAFVPKLLDQQMDEQFSSWLANPLKGMSLSAESLKLSPIFDWFASDFCNNNKSAIDWVIKYAPIPDSEYLQAHREIPVEYFTYNWNLNGDVSALCGVARRTCFPWWGLLTVCTTVGLLIVVLACVMNCKKQRGYTIV